MPTLKNNSMAHFDQSDRPDEPIVIQPVAAPLSRGEARRGTAKERLRRRLSALRMVAFCVALAMLGGIAAFVFLALPERIEMPFHLLPPLFLQPPASHHTQFTCSSSQLSHNLAALCMQMNQFYCLGMDREQIKSRLKRFFSFRR